MNRQIKQEQTHRYREQIAGYQSGEVFGPGDEIGEGD